MTAMLLLQGLAPLGLGKAERASVCRCRLRSR